MNININKYKYKYIYIYAIVFFNQCIFLARPVLDPGHAECVCKRCSNESKPSCPWFFPCILFQR